MGMLYYDDDDYTSRKTLMSVIYYDDDDYT